MASISAGEIRSCLLGKLQATESTGGPHQVFVIVDDAGNRIARTHLSYSFRRNTQLSDRIINDIKKQLALPRIGDLELLVECTMTRAAYLDLVSS